MFFFKYFLNHIYLAQAKLFHRSSPQSTQSAANVVAAHATPSTTTTHCATQQSRPAIDQMMYVTLLLTIISTSLQNKAAIIFEKIKTRTCKRNDDPTFAFTDETHIVDTKRTRRRRRIEL